MHKSFIIKNIINAFIYSLCRVNYFLMFSEGMPLLTPQKLRGTKRKLKKRHSNKDCQTVKEILCYLTTVQLSASNKHTHTEFPQECSEGEKVSIVPSCELFSLCDTQL